MPVHVADDPLTCVARGTGIVLEELDGDGARARRRDLLAAAALTARHARDPAMTLGLRQSGGATARHRVHGAAGRDRPDDGLLVEPGRPRPPERGRASPSGRSRARSTASPAASPRWRPRSPRSTGCGPTTPSSATRTTDWPTENARLDEIRRENELLTGLLQLQAGFDFKTAAGGRDRSRFARVPPGRSRSTRAPTTPSTLGDSRGRHRRRARRAGHRGRARQRDGHAADRCRLDRHRPARPERGDAARSSASSAACMVMSQIDSGEKISLGDEVVTAGIELAGGIRSPYPQGPPHRPGRRRPARRQRRRPDRLPAARPRTSTSSSTSSSSSTTRAGCRRSTSSRSTAAARACCPRASSRATRRLRRGAPDRPRSPDPRLVGWAR